MWSFSKARKRYPSSPIVAVGWKVVLTVVTALTAVAFIGLALDISATLVDHHSASAYISAGPLGLLVAGAAVAWPAACLRAGSSRQDDSDGTQRSWKLPLLAGTLHVAVIILYWIVLRALGVSVLTAQVLIGTVAAVALAYVLARLLTGARSALTGFLSAGILAAVLAATIVWPLLWIPAYSPLGSPSAYVNIVGKWMYLTVAVLVVTGLCFMAARAAWIVTEPYGRAWRWARAWRRAGCLAVTAVIALAVLPDTVTDATLTDPHAVGLVPVNLFGLFDAMPSLVDWVLLALAVMVVMGLPASPDPRPVARAIAVPIALELFYWNDTWLYLPVTMLVGLLLVMRLMLPKDLAEEAPHPRRPPAALRRAIAKWQNAAFVAGQRQALAASSTDSLRDCLVKNDEQAYDQALAALTKAEKDLTKKHDKYQGEALDAATEAFDHKGAALDKKRAKTGIIVGALLGIVPAAQTLLATQPPPGNGSYPVLNFLGSAAWSFALWPILGWFIGYFLPLIRGSSGAEKAMWMFITAAGATIPIAVVWNDSHGWTSYLINNLMLLTFLLLAAIILCDFCVMKDAGLKVTDWVRVHNWRFVVTWSAALVAAIGTAVATFLSTAATDLSQHTVYVVTRQISTPPGNSG